MASDELAQVLGDLLSSDDLHVIVTVNQEGGVLDARRASFGEALALLKEAQERRTREEKGRGTPATSWWTPSGGSERESQGK